MHGDSRGRRICGNRSGGLAHARVVHKARHGRRGRVQPPRRRAVVVHRRAAHVALVRAIRSCTRPVLHRAVVPHDQVPGLLPIHRHGKGLVADVRVEPLDQVVRFLLVHALDVVQVRAHVQVEPPAGLVPLQDVMAHLRLRRRVQVAVELRVAQLARMGNVVRADVIVREQLLLQVGGQCVERRARVGEICVVAARARGRYLDGAQQAVRGAARVEGRVDVENEVALPLVSARRVRVEDVAIGVEVAGVKDLDVLVAQLATGRQESLDVVEITEPAGEGDVAVVVEARIAEEEEAILRNEKKRKEEDELGNANAVMSRQPYYTYVYFHQVER